jgi:hypothetical protein
MRYEVENPMITYREFEPKVVAYCCNCSNSLHSDEEFLEFDHEYFCDDSCFIEYMGVRKIEGWEVE